MARRQPVDVVALVLALALALGVVGIIGGTVVQILHTGHGPEVELSDNATQILVGTVGALTGLLGGYMGSRRPTRPPEPDNDEGQGDDDDDETTGV